MYSGTVGSLVEFMEQVVGDEVVKTWQLYYFCTGRAEGQLSGGRVGRETSMLCFHIAASSFLHMVQLG